MKSVQQIEGNPLVQCSCGRSVNADMMKVLGDGYGCDACYETQIRTGQMTREEFALSQGAPSDVVARAQRLDLAKASDSLLRAPA